MVRQGNTWSTATACVTMPSNMQAWHRGWVDSWSIRLRFQKDVWYSRQSVILFVLRLPLYVLLFMPPCSKHRDVSLLLGFLHPSIEHMVLLGTVGIAYCFLNCSFIILGTALFQVIL